MVVTQFQLTSTLLGSTLGTGDSEAGRPTVKLSHRLLIAMCRSIIGPVASGPQSLNAKG